MASPQDPVAEAVIRLADQIDVLVTALQAAADTIAASVRQASPPPQMTAEGVTS